MLRPPEASVCMAIYRANFVPVVTAAVFVQVLAMATPTVRLGLGFSVSPLKP